MDSLLKLHDCTIRFGGLTAVASFSMDICKRELVGLIGHNGAGKTTVCNMVTGVYRPTQGDVFLAGERLNGLKPYAIT
jgi:branched-chain amino acid transport system ATP-binding protein